MLEENPRKALLDAQDAGDTTKIMLKTAVNTNQSIDCKIRKLVNLNMYIVPPGWLSGEHVGLMTCWL